MTTDAKATPKAPPTAEEKAMSEEFQAALEQTMNKQGSEKVDITAEEAQRFQQAVKDPEFCKLMKDYMDEISDPQHRKEQEEYIRQLEKDDKVPDNKTLVRPKPGFCIKVKSSEEVNNKVFINICHNENSEHVGEPAAMASGKGQNWSLPHLVSPVRMEKDKSGKNALTFDVCFHSLCLTRAAGSPPFRNMLIQTALDVVEKGLQKHQNPDLTLSRDFHIVKGILCKGDTPAVMMISSPATGGKAGAATAAAQRVASGGAGAAASASAGAGAGSASAAGGNAAASTTPKSSSSSSKKKDGTAASHTYDKGYQKFEDMDVDALEKEMDEAEAKLDEAEAVARAMSRKSSTADKKAASATASASTPSARGQAPTPTGGDKPKSKSKSKTGGSSGSGAGAGGPARSKPAPEGFTQPEFTVVESGQFDLANHVQGKEVTRPFPKRVVVRIDMPGLKSAGGLDLDVSDRRLRLKSSPPGDGNAKQRKSGSGEAPLYFLDIPMPYPVFGNKGGAKFDKGKSQLVVTVPVRPPPPAPTPAPGAGSSLIQETEIKSNKKETETETETEGSSKENPGEGDRLPPPVTAATSASAAAAAASRHDRWVSDTPVEEPGESEEDRKAREEAMKPFQPTPTPPKAKRTVAPLGVAEARKIREAAKVAQEAAAAAAAAAAEELAASIQQELSRKCGGCGGWGVGLVPAGGDGLCAHCRHVRGVTAASSTTTGDSVAKTTTKKEGVPPAPVAPESEPVSASVPAPTAPNMTSDSDLTPEYEARQNLKTVTMIFKVAGVETASVRLRLTTGGRLNLSFRAKTKPRANGKEAETEEGEEGEEKTYSICLQLEGVVTPRSTRLSVADRNMVLILHKAQPARWEGAGVAVTVPVGENVQGAGEGEMYEICGDGEAKLVDREEEEEKGGGGGVAKGGSSSCGGAAVEALKEETTAAPSSSGGERQEKVVSDADASDSAVSAPTSEQDAVPASSACGGCYGGGGEERSEELRASVQFQNQKLLYELD